METKLTNPTQPTPAPAGKVCEACGVPITGKGTRCRFHEDEYRRKDTAERNAQILARIEAGVKPATIAQELRVSRQAISSIMRREQKRQGKEIGLKNRFNAVIPGASCTPELKQALVALAHRKGVSLSTLVRVAVTEFIAKEAQ